MSFSRVAQLDAISLNGDIGKLFANYAIKVVQNFTGAMYDLDAEVASITKTAINIFYIIKFGVTPGGDLCGLNYRKGVESLPNLFHHLRILGCAIVFCWISYLKSRKLINSLTRLSDFAIVLNFVAFLINGIYPSLGDRLFDLRPISKRGPGDVTIMAGHKRELLFHLIMETFNAISRLSFDVTGRHDFPRKYMSQFLQYWLSKDDTDSQQVDNFSCVICKTMPVNALRGGNSVLNAPASVNDDQLLKNSCDCFYCHTCFFNEIALDSQTSCNNCGKQFPPIRT